MNDAERLCIDLALRHVVGGRASQPDRQAASASEVGRFKTEILSTQVNLTKQSKNVVKFYQRLQHVDRVVGQPRAEDKPLALGEAVDLLQDPPRQVVPPSRPDRDAQQ